MHSTVLGAAIKYEQFSEITMESGTHVKSVKITLNIFLVCPSWCGTQARSSEGGLSFHSTESNQEGLLKLKARICIVNWLLLQQHRRQEERSKSAQVSKLELMIYRFLRWQRCNTLILQILAIFEKVGSTVNHFNIKSIILSNILFCFMS